MKGPVGIFGVTSLDRTPQRKQESSSTMGKKRNRKNKQQQPAFKARGPDHYYAQLPNRTLVKVPIPQKSAQPSTYIAPEQQQESMVDLTDDTSHTPSTSTGGWKPVQGAAGTSPTAPSTGIKMTRAEKIFEEHKNKQKEQTPTRAEKIWQDFKSNLGKPSAIHKIGLKKEEPKPSQKPGPSKKTESTEIKWELNVLDEKEDSSSVGNAEKEVTSIPLPKPIDPPKPKVIQGTAAEIKLFQAKDKPVAVQTPVTKEVPTVPVTGNTPNTTDSTVTETPIHRELKEVPKSRKTKLPALPPMKPTASIGMAGIPRSFLHKRVQEMQETIESDLLRNVQDWAYGVYDNPPGYVANLYDNPGNIYDKPSLHDKPVEVNTMQSSDSPTEEQQYSPSDVYGDGEHLEPANEGSQSPEGQDGQSGQKRLSAFHRLGPVSQPKKPKLTINLVCSKDGQDSTVRLEKPKLTINLVCSKDGQDSTVRLGPVSQPKKPKLTINLVCSKDGQDSTVREVVEDEIEDTTPVHLRKEIIESKDEIVKKYLPFWPYKRYITPKKSVGHRTSKSVMILEQEQMEEYYEKDNIFIQIHVRGYPKFWKKEHVLDAILDAVKGKSLIPCFIEFTKARCKFFVIRSRQALQALHKLGFFIRKDDVEMSVSISVTDLNINHLDFIPRLVLRKLLSAGYDGERMLSLREFTLKSDLSNFIYFPLNRVTNQTELIQIQSTVAWDYLTDLDLSHNRITSIDGLDLPKTTPKLKHLDLSFNYLEKATSLLHIRELSLRSIKLEGNPLCHDYIDPAHYVRVLKMIFPALTHIDGVPIHLKGDLPPSKRNYCPSEAAPVVNRYLEVLFPLLEAPLDERDRIEDMYDEMATLTVTYRYCLRYNPLYRKFRTLFLRARIFDEGEFESIDGAPAIARLICKWPTLQHDPYTFTVDVLHHNDFTTILRVDGILKLTSDTLAEDEYLLAFTRTVVLTSHDGAEYKIMNEMLCWDEPCREWAHTAFQINTVSFYGPLLDNVVLLRTT
ncbi:leucine rich repeats (2 copies) domain-containing protein [Phthorimaea operculella]|nr:leucine rich repeats (2 copies) domain-containing protein [Phthorimaea operculella]